MYTSKMEPERRQQVIDEFKSGKISILCAVDVLNEGADLPFVECLLFLRPTESKRIFFQQLGRGLRRYIGKPHCTVIDLIGNFKNANRIVEYQGLLSFGEIQSTDIDSHKHRKDAFSLPLGCKVSFDEHVIDLFYDQTLDASFVTRYNIRGILIHQYNRLARRLSRAPTKKEIDRNCLLGRDIYETCFGSWKEFEEMMASGNYSHGHGFDLGNMNSPR
ncbi:MAG: helicase-related protein [Limisphaerales bacterium]|uniref:helicase-related protein n=1 Tax=Candidatus Binatus sp. TaxID=2811406 RepID=UPI003CA36240